jgi:hypothetical protein
VADVQLWVSVDGDPPVPVGAGTAARLDELDARVSALESAGTPATAAYVDAGDATVADGAAAALADHAADSTGVHGIADTSELATRAALPIAAADHGVVGDGVTDDTAALQAAVTAAGTARGAVTITGTVRVTGPIPVPDGVTVAGLGPASVVQVDPGFSFPVFCFDGTAGAVRDLTVRKAPGAQAVAGGNAVRVCGNTDGVTVTGVVADGMATGFYVAGQLGSTVGAARRTLFSRCTARNSVLYGFEVDEADGTEIVHCVSDVSGLDGVKLRRKTRNTRIVGGYYTGATGGDGLDAFAGGDTFTIDGAVFAGNAINGVTVKNDDLNRTDPSTYGYVRSVNLLGVIATGNGGSGIACHRSSGNPDDPTEPLVSGVNIVGGQLDGNGCYGLYLNARRVTAVGVSATRNGLDGVYLEPACRDVDLHGVHAAGNSTTTPGTRDGIHVNGQRIRIVGGSSIGSDPDGATGDADLAAALPTQRYGLRVEAGAVDVAVDGLRMLHNTAGPLSDASGSVRWAGPAAGSPLIPGMYIAPGGVRATLPMTQWVEYAVPVLIAQPGTLVRLGVEVTAPGAAGTIIRLGVRADLAHRPGPVLAESTVPGDAVTPGVECAVSAPIAAPGVYWLVAVAQGGTPTVRSTTGPTGMAAASPSLAAALGGTPNGGYITAANVTGFLPATYTVANRAGALPLIAARA